MEHLRPNGLSQGYFCSTCGGVTNMVGSGHEDCTPNRKLVEELFSLNENVMTPTAVRLKEIQRLLEVHDETLRLAANDYERTAGYARDKKAALILERGRLLKD